MSEFYAMPSIYVKYKNQKLDFDCVIPVDVNNSKVILTTDYCNIRKGSRNDVKSFLQQFFTQAGVRF